MTTAVDIVTLENFGAKMPRWEPDDLTGNHLFALVDMGSNGIRFSISDLSLPHARLLKCIYRERAPISLFDALSTSVPLTFPDETITLVASTLARFRSVAVDHYGVAPERVAVFATEAMRRAANAGAMLDAIQAAAPGLTVQILAPPVETLFGAVGARSSFIDVRGLFLDLGGGSVQMTYMDTYAARAEGGGNAAGDSEVGYEIAAALTGESLPFGAARLIRVLESADGRVQVAEKSKLQAGMYEAFEKLRKRFPTLAAAAARAQVGSEAQGSEDAGIDIYLCGGGFRGYGYMLMHNDPITPYPIPAVGTYTARGSVFCQTQRMLEVNRTYAGKIFGMSRRRRAQFPAIVAVVDALITAVPRIRSATFCAGGNREGALMMKLPRDVRESNPLRVLSSAMSESLSAAGASRAADQQVLASVVSTLRSAIPAGMDLQERSTTVFGLHLDALLVRQAWLRTGEDADANAAAALHDAVTRDASCPGMTHLARAVLAVALCYRWGGSLGPVDQPLHRNLCTLVDNADPDGSFWAEYAGAVAAAMAKVVPAWPQTAERIRDAMRFQATCEMTGGSKNKLKINVKVFISSQAAGIVDLEDLATIFKGVGKQREDRKVTATVHVITAGA